jgi:hypothetical protein
MPSSMSPKGSAPASSRVVILPRRLAQRPPFGGDRGAWRKTNSPEVLQSLPAQDSYLPEMPVPKVYEFSKHICALCATRGTDVFKLGTKLASTPMELLQMINGKVVPTRTVISGLAKELHSCVPPHKVGR